MDMATATLVATTALVNNRGSTPDHPDCWAGYDRRMETLLSRLEWVLVQRDMSARQLSLQSGLSHAAVATMIRTLKADPEAAKRVEIGTLHKLARAAGVDPTWLQTGAGTPEFDQSPAPMPDPDPSTDATSIAAKFKNLANWTALLRAARALRPSLPEWVWMKVADARPMLTTAPTPLLIAEFADLISRHEAPPA